MSNHKYYYCKKWFIAKKFAIEPWSEERANKAHIDGTEYSVLSNDLTRPDAVIVMAGLNNFIGLELLDEYLRVVKAVQFHEYGDGKQFLAKIVNREYEGTSDNIIATTSFSYSQSGKLSVRRRTYNPNTMDSKDMDFSVENHIFERPCFGNYDHLLNIDFSVYEK